MTETSPNSSPSTFVFAAWLWIRLLGIVYIFAFASLGLQIVGLIGHDGILPADAYMTRAAAALAGTDRLRFLPTIAWLGTSDAFLRALCVAGAALGALVTAGVAPVIALPILWLLYLSLVVVGREFLGYQWDALLLEAGLLSAFTAPWALRHRLTDARNPPVIGRALLLWLLVRLTVESGMVKLASGDPTWRGLTALSFHFWTQPLPTPLAWYANQLPAAILAFATAATLAIELVAVFLVFAPASGRAIGFALLVGLQAAIALTGNYAFFNLLTAALCVWMLDDATVARLLPRAARRHAALPANGGLTVDAPGAQVWLAAAFAIVTVPVSVYNVGLLGANGGAIPFVGSIAATLAPLRSVNAYGLFAVMTTERPQIILEGSNDGNQWKAYTFKYQPEDVRQRPRWVAPHQPRLDWQLWFAALGTYEDEAWFRSFLAAILRGSPDVRALLSRDPFDGRPPAYVRALLYRYRFTTPAERRESGAWWHRDLAGPYSPVVSSAGADMRR